MISYAAHRTTPRHENSINTGSRATRFFSNLRTGTCRVHGNRVLGETRPGLLLFNLFLSPQRPTPIVTAPIAPGGQPPSTHHSHTCAVLYNYRPIQHVESSPGSRARVCGWAVQWPAAVGRRCWQQRCGGDNGCQQPAIRPESQPDRECQVASHNAFALLLVSAFALLAFLPYSSSSAFHCLARMMQYILNYLPSVQCLECSDCRGWVFPKIASQFCSLLAERPGFGSAAIQAAN